MGTASETTKFKSIYDLLQALPDDNACRAFLEDLRWSGVPTCPHCGSINHNHYKLKTKGVFAGLYKCKDCRNRFTVTVGTMFEGSHLSLRKWLIAIYIFTSYKKGISSIQLGKELNITQKSAWFVLSRLRHNFKPTAGQKFERIIQNDESFVGRMNANRHKSKRMTNGKGRGVNDKTSVFNKIENGDQVCTQFVDKNKLDTLSL